MICNCSGWARSYPEEIISEHHRDCEKYNPMSEAKKIISDLLEGIKTWAADEDGVHYYCCDAYNRAAIAIGVNTLTESEAENGKH